MEDVKITLSHPYRPLFTAVWLLFAVLFILGYAQGQSLLILVLGVLCLLMAPYTFWAQTEIIAGSAVITVQKRPINLRTRTISLAKIETFTTNANRRQLEDDDEQMGYHQTRPTAYDIEAVLKTGRALLLAEAHTEEAALTAVAQLQMILTHAPSSPH